MNNIAHCVERQHCTQDKFQSYICYILALGAIFATIPPIIVVLLEQDTSGCIDKEFVVYAHYSTHEWLTDKFNTFSKESTNVDNFCYELRIQDSALVNDVKPSIWIPETFVWIDIAEEKIKREHPTQLKHNENGKLINNRSTDCTHTTNTPFGIITWKKFANLLSPNGDTISFKNITDLANVSWYQFTNGSIENVYPTGVESLYIAHGHPNVTTGGLLGFLEAFNTLDGIEEDHFFEFDYNSECTEEESHQKHFENILSQIEILENNVISTAPIDYTLVDVMRLSGPKYLHMAFGFENDVALLNQRYKKKLLKKWNDTLAFIYLEKTYWIEHPMCKLTGANWYKPEVAKVADEFVDWITSSDSNHIADLEQYGLRPFNISQNVTTSIISTENGCNLNIKREFEYAEPTAEISSCMRKMFQVVKKRIHITILLDVSGNMQQSISDKFTRWKSVSDYLPLLADNLEDSATVNLICFHEFLLEGPGCSPTPYPNGTLAQSRDDLKDYFANKIAPNIGEDKLSLFDSLLETYVRVNKTQILDPEFKYIIFVLTEDDKSSKKKENADIILERIGLSDNPEQIRIYPILYYGFGKGITHTTLKQLANRTHGRFSTASADDLQDVITEFTYYW